MDVQKLELLLKKISQAIKTIQQLKEKEDGYLSEIKALSDEIVLLKEENLSLKNENAQMEKEIQKNNLIHNELENKITEILKFLPEEEPDKEVTPEQTSLADTNRVDEKPALSKNIAFEDEIPFENTDTPDENELESSSFLSVGKETDVINSPETSVMETEEEMLKKFVQEQKDINNVFNMEAKNFPELNDSQEEPHDEESVTVNSFPGMDTDSGVRIKDDTKISAELFDNDTEEIEFNFEDRQNDDLPKGVL